MPAFGVLCYSVSVLSGAVVPKAWVEETECIYRGLAANTLYCLSGCRQMIKVCHPAWTLSRRN